MEKKNMSKKSKSEIMYMRRSLKNIFGAVLIAALVFAFAFSAATFVRYGATDVIAADGSLSASVLNVNSDGTVNNNIESLFTGGQSENIYFGMDGGVPVKWRVLKKNDTKYGVGKNLLLWKDVGINDAYHSQAKLIPTTYYWGTSEIRSKFNGIDTDGNPIEYYGWDTSSNSSKFMSYDLASSYAGKYFTSGGDMSQLEAIKGIDPSKPIITRISQYDPNSSPCLSFVWVKMALGGTGQYPLVDGIYDVNGAAKYYSEDSDVIGNSASVTGGTSYVMGDKTSGERMFLLDYEDINSRDYGFVDSNTGKTYLEGIKSVNSNLTWNSWLDGMPAYWEYGNNLITDALKSDGGNMSGYYVRNIITTYNSSTKQFQPGSIIVYDNILKNGVNVNDAVGISYLYANSGYTFQARPAMMIDTSKVVYASGSAGYVPAGSFQSVQNLSSTSTKPEYKIYVKDTNFGSYTFSPKVTSADNKVKVSFTNPTGKAGNVVVLLTERGVTNGSVAYQAVAPMVAGSAKQTAEFTLPSGITYKNYMPTVMLTTARTSSTAAKASETVYCMATQDGIITPEDISGVTYDAASHWLDSLGLTEIPDWIDESMHCDTTIINVKKILYKSNAADATETDITAGGTAGIKDAGTYKITLEIADTALHWQGGGTDDKEFIITIAKRKSTANPALTSSDTLFTGGDFPEIKDTKGTPGTYTFDEGQTPTAGTHEYNWTFTPTDTNNYTVERGKISLTFVARKIKSLSAVYKNDNNDKIYTSATLDDLRDYIVVTATYNDNTTGTLSSYLLDFASGSKLKVGENKLSISESAAADAQSCNVTIPGVLAVEPTEILSIKVKTGTTFTYPVTADTVKAGLEVRVKNNDGTTVMLTDLSGLTIEGSIVAGEDVELTAKIGTLSETFTINVEQGEYDMSKVSFANKQVTYDGSAKSIAITGTLPDNGITVTYEYKDASGNVVAASDVKAVGIYTVTAKFGHSNSNYKAVPDMTATLEITDKKVYDTSGATTDVSGATKGGDGKYTATFTPGGKVTFVAGGDIKDAEGNVVSGITRTIKYEKKDASGNWITVTADDITDAGEYRITIEYSGEDGEYAEISDEVIDLVIDQAEIPDEEIRFTGDGAESEDGLKFSIEAGGEVPEFAIDPDTLPAGVNVTGVTVTYEKKDENGNWQPFNGTPSDVGEYRARLEVEHDNPNYKDFGPLYAELEVKKASMSLDGITFEDVTVTYDGEEHGIEITGVLPDGVTVTYEGNGQITAGEYTITAKFSHNNPNYGDIADKTATLIIEKAKVSLPVYDGSIRYTGEEVGATGDNFSYDKDIVEFVRTQTGIEVGVYNAVFMLKDAVNYEWASEENINTVSAFGMLAVLYEEATQSVAEREVPWELGKAIVSAAVGSNGLPVLSSDSYKGSFDGIVEYKYYTDESCAEEVSYDALEKDKTYYVKASLGSNNFELDGAASQLLGGTFEYTHVGEPTFIDNLISFFAANWIWFAIGLGALLFILLIVLLAIRHKKKAAKRAKLEAEAEERRHKEELEEKRRAEEREERRRKEELEERKREEAEERRRREEEREERRLERESRMQSYAMPQPMMPQPMMQQPMMPQMPAQVPVQAGGAAVDNSAIMASIRAEFDKMRAEQNASKMELELAKMRIEQQAAKEINNARLEAEFARLRSENQPYAVNGQNGTANMLGGLLVAALQKYASDTSGMPILPSEEKLALPESSLVGGVVPGAITTMTTTTTVDASGRSEDKPLPTTSAEVVPNAEGLFNRRGRSKTDGYDVDNFYNFFDEQEKK